MVLNLKSIRVFFFDLDGVLSVGKENPRYISGRRIVAKIKSSGKKAAVLTNDSTHTRVEIKQNLTTMGFSFEEREILTSSYLTAIYLMQRFGKTGFFLVGEEGLKRELEAVGHHQTDEGPSAVVVGFDRKLTYEKLNKAMILLREGAFLIGSYGGAVFMSDNGPALSAGPIIKALEYGSGKRAIIVGKPSSRMFQLALQDCHEQARDAVMIGDQIETDLIGARRAGVHTVLVLTGVENLETIRRSRIKPEIVVETADELTQYL